MSPALARTTGVVVVPTATGGAVALTAVVVSVVAGVAAQAVVADSEDIRQHG